MNSVLVTGGCGFVGSFLCEALIRKGLKVYAVDNFITGSRKNHENLMKDSRFELIEQNVSEGLPKLKNLSAVFHLASPASPKDFVPLAKDILKVGSYGTFHALELAKENNAWFLLASTSEVYGDPLVHPQKESYLGNVNPIGVRGVYDESKRFAEAVTFSYLRAGLVKTSVARIFNTYGPRMRPDDGRVVSNFINQALSNQNITVYGEGLQTRSFCYVNDLVAGLMAFYEKQPTGPFNLGNDHESKVIDIAKKVLELTGSKSKIQYDPLPADDPKQRCPDLSQTRSVLGWSATTPLEEGLLKTIEHFKGLKN